MPKGWTLADMPRQDGRRALLTGANSGIGWAAALELARHGAAVVLAARNQGRLDEAAARIRREVPGSTVETSLLDLADLGSIHRCAERELADPQPLDLLINNAGIMAPGTRHTTPVVDGHGGLELQFGTNVAGHFLLTGLLLPKLQQRSATVTRTSGQTGGLVAGEQEQPRIVTISSIAHRRSRLYFPDLQGEQHYSPHGAYQQSKLANLALSLELARRLEAHGSAILAAAAHPGLSNTRLFQADHLTSIPRPVRNPLGHTLELLFNSSALGALPTLFAATAPTAVSGGYYGPSGVLEFRGSSVTAARIAPQARDLADATRLWNTCEDLTGLRYLDKSPPCLHTI